jgi:hypothetical protein
VIICIFIVLHEFSIDETDNKLREIYLCSEKCTFLKFIPIEIGRAGMVPFLH